MPPCYTPDYPPGYPVLYLLHGQGFFDDQWDRIGATATADRLIAAGEVKPFIVVMPYDSDYRQPSQAPFGEALVQSLVPWIDAHYPTRATSAARAIGGLSRGAAWALHLGLLHPDVFSAIGAHSLPIFWEDASQLSTWLSALPPEAIPRLYIDIGSSDTDLLPTEQFEQMLDQRGIPHEWHLFRGYHDETYWSAHVEQYLRWYASAWD
jgi:enterochelin esterase-like enzyme